MIRPIIKAVNALISTPAADKSFILFIESNTAYRLSALSLKGKDY